MSQVVTELVIDADTSGADAYARAMDGAADAATRGTGAASNFNLGLAVLGVGMLGAATAAKQGIDYIADFNKSLADMSRTAERVGLSLRDLQGVEFGGKIKGLSDGQINAGLEKSAQLLNDAQRNANSLSKEFEVNGISIRNANGQLISQNQLLQVAGDLVSRARNPQDAIAIAQMLGFTKEWVPLLEQGGVAMAALGDEAQKAGAVIDDATVQKAAQFDQEWRKSSVEFAVRMKAAVADILPYVDDLIQRASGFLADLQKAPSGPSTPWLDNSKTVDRAFGNVVRGGLKAAGIDPDQTWKVEIAPELTADWDKLSGKVSDYISSASDETKSKMSELMGWWKENILDLAVYAIPKALSQVTDGAIPARPVTVGRVPDDQRVWYTGAPGITDTSSAQSDAAWGAQGGAWKQFSDSVTGTNGFGGASKVASRDTGGDAVDRAINSLRRHTEQQEADTKAVGLGAGALAGFRAAAAETSAVQANGGKETDAQRKAFADLKAEATAAADALAKAKVASQIDFGRKTAFLSQDDVAIATQLTKIYGNDVPTALNSTEAAQLRLNKTMKDTSDAFQNAAAPALVDFEMGAKNGSDAIKAFEQQFVKSLLTMANQALIFGPISKALQGAVTGGFSLFPSAHGNIFSGGNVVPFAQGGVVDSPTIAPMALFGEAGPEAIMPLRRDASGNLGVAGGSGGGGTSIVYQVNAAGADSGTVLRIQQVLAAHAKAIAGQGKALKSANRQSRTGVG